MSDMMGELLELLPSGPRAFARRFEQPFLVRRPRSLFPQAGEAATAPSQFEYRTASLSPAEDGLMPWEWWVASMTKRAGNPFPDHLSVGRAQNSDIVMRFRFVSKLHARFHLSDGRVVAVEDCASANGTEVNGRRLPPGSPLEVQLGDRISFGSLEVELLSPEACFALLKTRRIALSNPPER